MTADILNIADREDARARRMKAVEAVAVQGMTAREAAAFSGLKQSTVTALLKDPRVKQYMQEVQRAHAEAMNVRREDVIRGILEAIDHAKVTNEPAVEIRGWEAIAKMQGYNAPETVLHDLPDDTKRMMEKLQGMNDSDLAKLAGMDNLIDLHPEEGYQRVSDEAG